MNTLKLLAVIFVISILTSTISNLEIVDFDNRLDKNKKNLDSDLNQENLFDDIVQEKMTKDKKQKDISEDVSQVTLKTQEDNEWYEGETIYTTYNYEKGTVESNTVYSSYSTTPIINLGVIQNSKANDGTNWVINNSPSELSNESLSFNLFLSIATYNNRGNLYFEGYLSDLFNSSDLITTNQNFNSNTSITADYINVEGYLEVYILCETTVNNSMTMKVWIFDNEGSSALIANESKSTIGNFSLKTFILSIDAIIFYPDSRSYSVDSCYRYLSSKTKELYIEVVNEIPNSEIIIKLPEYLEFEKIVPLATINIITGYNLQILNTIETNYQVFFRLGNGYANHTSYFLPIKDESERLMVDVGFEKEVGSRDADWEMGDWREYQKPNNMSISSDVYFEGRNSLRVGSESVMAINYKWLPAGEYYLGFSAYYDAGHWEEDYPEDYSYLPFQLKYADHLWAYGSDIYESIDFNITKTHTWSQFFTSFTVTRSELYGFPDTQLYFYCVELLGYLYIDSFRLYQVDIDLEYNDFENANFVIDVITWDNRKNREAEDQLCRITITEAFSGVIKQTISDMVTNSQGKLVVQLDFAINQLEYLIKFFSYRSGWDKLKGNDYFCDTPSEEDLNAGLVDREGGDSQIPYFYNYLIGSYSVRFRWNSMSTTTHSMYWNSDEDADGTSLLNFDYTEYDYLIFAGMKDGVNIEFKHVEFYNSAWNKRIELRDSDLYLTSIGKDSFKYYTVDLKNALITYNDLISNEVSHIGLYIRNSDRVGSLNFFMDGLELVKAQKISFTPYYINSTNDLLYNTDVMDTKMGIERSRPVDTLEQGHDTFWFGTWDFSEQSLDGFVTTSAIPVNGSLHQILTGATKQHISYSMGQPSIDLIYYNYALIRMYNYAGDFNFSIVDGTAISGDFTPITEVISVTEIGWKTYYIPTVSNLGLWKTDQIQMLFAHSSGIGAGGVYIDHLRILHIENVDVFEGTNNLHLYSDSENFDTLSYIEMDSKLISTSITEYSVFEKNLTVGVHNITYHTWSKKSAIDITIPIMNTSYSYSIGVDEWQFTLCDYKDLDQRNNFVFATTWNNLTANIYENATFKGSVAENVVFSWEKYLSYSAIRNVTIVIEDVVLAYFYQNEEPNEVKGKINYFDYSADRLSIIVSCNIETAVVIINDNASVGIEANLQPTGAYVFDRATNYGIFEINVTFVNDYNEDGIYQSFEIDEIIFPYYVFMESIRIEFLDPDTTTNKIASVNFATNYGHENLTEFRVKTDETADWSEWMFEHSVNGVYTWDTSSLQEGSIQTALFEFRVNGTFSSGSQQIATSKIEYVTYRPSATLLNQDPVVYINDDEEVEALENLREDQKAQFNFLGALIVLLIVIVFARYGLDIYKYLEMKINASFEQPQRQIASSGVTERDVQSVKYNWDA